MAKPARILLVEDESDVMQANREFLTGKGYEVFSASLLRDALACMWEYPPDLILLDVMLPDGSGFEFCQKIREFTTVPVIFLTALGEDSSIIGGLGLGADDYIVKPYNLEVMGARVAAQLRHHGHKGGKIELPPLRIDLVSGRVWLHDEEIDLSRREYQLLLYLVEHRGQELSQTAIYEALWGAGPETMGNTVRMHASRLRSKLQMNSDNSCFELSATSNHGYVFLRIRYPSTAE